MNKQLEKELKNRIRQDNMKKWFYKLDKLFKFTKVNINKIELDSQYKDTKYYNVEYEFGFNVFNPFTWIILIPSFLPNVFDVLKECLEEVLNLPEYCGTFNVNNKDKDNKDIESR